MPRRFMDKFEYRNVETRFQQRLLKPSFDISVESNSICMDIRCLYFLWLFRYRFKFYRDGFLFPVVEDF